jgi:hypothetical protein
MPRKKSFPPKGDLPSEKPNLDPTTNDELRDNLWKNLKTKIENQKE